MQLAQLAGKDYNSIIGSRPGMGNPTSAVPAGLYQFELGTNLTTSPGMDTTIVIPLLLRMGIYKNTEWQVGFVNDYLTMGVLYGGINIISGLENSIIFTTSVSENTDSLTEYSAYLPISYTFGNGFTISGQITETNFQNKKLDPIFSYSLAAGSPLGDKIGWFFEIYQSQTRENNRSPNIPMMFLLTENTPLSIDFGITYLSENNLQFDLSMGRTFHKFGSDPIETERFLEWGVSFRLPK